MWTLDLNLYEGSSAYVKIEIKGKTFDVHRGVRQSNPLSPNLYNAVLEKVFNNLNWIKRGITIDGESLNNLRYADNVVLITTSL